MKDMKWVLDTLSAIRANPYPATNRDSIQQVITYLQLLQPDPLEAAMILCGDEILPAASDWRVRNQHLMAAIKLDHDIDKAERYLEELKKKRKELVVDAPNT